MATISPVDNAHGDHFADATIIVGAIVGAKNTPFMASISPVDKSHGDHSPMPRLMSVPS